MKYFLLFTIIFSLFFGMGRAGATPTIARAQTVDCTSFNDPAQCILQANCCLNGTTCQTGVKDTTSSTTIGSCAPTSSTEGTLTGDLTNPLSGSTAVVTTTELVGRVIKWIFAMVGALALLMFIIGGTYWLVSFGNETRITKGRQILIWASVGLLLIFSSYAIINYVLGSLVG